MDSNHSAFLEHHSIVSFACEMTTNLSFAASPSLTFFHSGKCSVFCNWLGIGFQLNLVFTLESVETCDQIWLLARDCITEHFASSFYTSEKQLFLRTII